MLIILYNKTRTWIGVINKSKTGQNQNTPRTTTPAKKLNNKQIKTPNLTNKRRINNMPEEFNSCRPKSETIMTIHL